MRLRYLVLVLSCLAAGGGVLLSARSSHALVPIDPADQDPIHPVTPQMLVATVERTGKPAPEFNLTDGKGKRWTLESATAGKPMFVYFILDGCPCSAAAEPFYQRLAKAYGDHASFAGIINADPSKAAAWAKDFGTPYPVLSDPKLVAIKGFEAKHSAYSALVVNGKITRMWPGYSVDMLREASGEIANAAHVPVAEIDTTAAPKKFSSGCVFG